MLKLTTVLFVMLAVFLIPIGLLFSSEIDLRNFTLPPKKNFKCGDKLVGTYKDSNNNIVSGGCDDFDADESTCEGASLTLEIKQSKGCTEPGYGYECTEEYMDTGHGNVTCEWVEIENRIDLEGNTEIVEWCVDSTFSETTSYRYCSDRDVFMEKYSDM